MGSDDEERSARGRGNASPESSTESPRASDSTATTRNSMADLEDELARLLDDAPLLPEDDDEGSGVDFEPPPRLRQPTARTESGPTGTTVDSPALGSPSPEQRSVDGQVPKAKAAPLAADAASATVESPARGATAAVAEPPEAERAPATTTERNDSTGGRDRPPRRVSGLWAIATMLCVVAIVAFGWFSSEWRSSGTRAHSVSASDSPRQPASLLLQAPSVPPAGSEQRASIRADAPESLPSQPASGVPPSNAVGAPALGAEREPSVEPAEAPPFNPRQALTALAPAGIKASRCRRSRDPAGRVYVKVVIGAGGEIESVFAGQAYRDSETLACIARKLRAVELPQFSGAGGTVVLPVLLK